jgi:small subunit ribosomal protein S16
MLTIRFSRIGKKNKAQFKIMLQEQAFAPGGKHVEILGSYDPHKKIAVLKEERIKYWLSKGVKASDTVHNLLVSKNVISDKKRAVKIPKKTEETKSEETKTEETKQEEKKEPEITEAKKEEKKENEDKLEEEVK